MLHSHIATSPHCFVLTACVAAIHIMLMHVYCVAICYVAEQKKKRLSLYKPQNLKFLNLK